MLSPPLFPLPCATPSNKTVFYKSRNMPPDRPAATLWNPQIERVRVVVLDVDTAPLPLDEQIGKHPYSAT